MNNILTAENIEKYYGSGNTLTCALRGINLSLSAGELTALLGPSGAGKSTLLSAIGLIRPPSAGKISIRGTVVFDNTWKVDIRAFRRNNIGYVFQKSNLIPFLNARENVQIAGELNSMSSTTARKRAEQLLQQLDMMHRVNFMPSNLSGGEQQRVAVARALVNEPALLLADEPTAALDSKRGRQVMELFKTVAKTHHAAVLVVTHDQRALDVFDRTLHMEDGSLLE